MATTTSAALAAIMHNVTFNRLKPDVKARWTVVRDVISGDQAVRAGVYLPRLNAFDVSPSNVSRNAAYRERATFYPATGFTLEGLMGLAFRIDPQVDLLPKLDYLLADVDGAGTSIYQQSQSALSNVLAVGRHGLYIDWAEGLGHPLIKEYAAESIINWRYSSVAGKTVLSMVVLEELIEEEDGPWGLREVRQWRDISLDENGQCVVRLYREGEQPDSPPAPQAWPGQEALAGDGAYKLTLRSRGKALDFIPFIFIGARTNDGKVDFSPLYGIAKVNIGHFRNSADYEDSVFFVGQVQPYITGLTTEWRDKLQNPVDAMGNSTGQVLYVGSRTPILLPAGGTFGYAQAQPNMLAFEAMKHKEEQLLALGARIVEEQGANKTATGENNDREASTSVLSMCVANVNEAYQWAVWCCAQFLDMGESFDASATYKINQDFVQAAANPAVLGELVKSWQSGIAAKNDVRAYFRKVNLIATERSDEDIDNDLKAEGPALGTLGLDDEILPGAVPPKLDAEGKPLPGQAPGATPPNDAPPGNSPPGNAPPNNAPPGSNPPAPNEPPAFTPAPSPAPANQPAPTALRSAAPPTGPNQSVQDVVPKPSREVLPALQAEAPPFDLAPLVAAINALAFAQQPQPLPAVLETAPAFDFTQLLAAIQALRIPAPVVNVPPATITPAPNLTVNLVVEKAGGNKTGVLSKKPDGSFGFEVITQPEN